MTRISITDLTFAHVGSHPILSVDSLLLEPGVMGLVGANGAGKSTFLQLLSGALRPSSGRVQRQDAEHVVHLSQLTGRTKAIEALFAYELPGAAASMAQFQLDPDWIHRWDSLSPGEKRRAQLAAQLADLPDVLLLDEPESHLDHDARLDLRRALSAMRRHAGIVLIVSHDRPLLDAVTSRTLWLERGTVTSFAGNYSQALEQHEAKQARLEIERDALRKEVRAAKSQLADSRRNQAAAANNLGGQSKGVRDHDGRSMGRKVTAGWAEARAGRNVHVARGELERKEQALAEAAHADKARRPIHFPYVPPRESRLGVLSVDALGPKEAPILRDVRLTLERDTRVRLLGDNGSGKSTLLDALAQALAGRHIVYLPQVIDDAERARLLSTTAELSPDERGHVLAALACLGGNVDAVRGGALSPGETRKLAIAHGLGRGAAALLLDEPETFLDLPSQRALEHALASYAGALVLVSHDATFAASATQQRWHVQNGRVDVA